LDIEHGEQLEVRAGVFDDRQPHQTFGVATALGTTKHRVNKCDERLALGVVGEDGLQVVARAGEPAVLELAVALTRPRADARSTSEPRSEPVGVMPVADQPPTRCTKLRAHIRATR